MAVADSMGTLMRAEDQGMTLADRAAHEAARGPIRRAAQTTSYPISDDLSAALARDSRAEAAGIQAERETCWAHQSWAEDCADHLMHTDPRRWMLQQASRLVTS